MTRAHPGLLRSTAFVALAVALGAAPGASAADRSAPLLKLAQQEFGRLSRAEQKLFRAAANGEIAAFGKGEASEAEAKGRTLHATRVRWLLTDRRAAAEVLPHEGVRIEGARIEGRIELRDTRIEFPLVIEHSVLPGGISLERARVRWISFVGSHVGAPNSDAPAIDADGLHAEALYLGYGFRAYGPVRLAEAHILDGLDLNGGSFLSPGVRAVDAARSTVGGTVYMGEGFRAEGEVNFVRAEVGGNLDSEGGTFLNPGGIAIEANRINVAGSVFMRGDKFRSEGEVSLLAAAVGGSFDMDEGTFLKPDGRAIDANQLVVGGAVFMRDGFRAEGEVAFLGATVGGNFELDHGSFLNPGGIAIDAERVSVGGSVRARDGFRAQGEVDLNLATVESSLVLKEIDDPTSFVLDLEAARVGTLKDEVASWPPQISLDGFTYERIDRGSPLTAKERISWLRRGDSPSFQPQPYRQLAHVLRETGHEEEATAVLVAMNRDPLLLAQMNPLRRVAHALLYLTISYGYRPAQAAVWMILVATLGAVLFHRGYQRNGFSPTGTGYAPPFNALMYSIDVFLPIIDFKQAEYWLPQERLLRVYLWLHIAAGWVLSTLFVVGLTGLVRR